MVAHAWIGQNANEDAPHFCPKGDELRKNMVRGKAMNDDPLDHEIDFSKGERGKFYRPGMKINIPVYLEQALMNGHPHGNCRAERHCSRCPGEPIYCGGSLVSIRSSRTSSRTCSQFAPGVALPWCTHKPSALTREGRCSTRFRSTPSGCSIAQLRVRPESQPLPERFGDDNPPRFIYPVSTINNTIYH